ncbi:hypothetical protein AVEN_79678-1 [Araneus ventricosus]|uniref:Uncharacterized protein n=1 Tax=Araneus ventricosus TaxID=182803 RepID=A0A4Y2M025_ARAVE|nr:hypothetical protein AVEN_79678-1 [Araneus ventricosus]
MNQKWSPDSSTSAVNECNGFIADVTQDLMDRIICSNMEGNVFRQASESSLSLRSGYWKRRKILLSDKIISSTPTFVTILEGSRFFLYAKINQF